MSREGEPTGDDGEQAYFRAVEDVFLRLRGAPLLLSPADWQVAASWYREGIPVALVTAALEELFLRRAERGTKGRVNSLRYCAPAVERAWGELREVQGPGRRGAAAGATASGAIPLAESLAELAAALPGTLPDREGWAARLTALSGSAEAVESSLAALEAEVLAAVEGAMPAVARRALEEEVEAAVERWRGRFPDGELDELRRRLWGRRLRQEAGLPVLSLFATRGTGPAPG